MKIQLCQTHIVWENKDENIAKAEEIIKNSSSDLILFPEMSFTGFSMNTDITGENDNYTLRAMKEITVNYNKVVGFGWVYKNGEKAENHYTFMDRGEIVSDYIKIHPFSYSGEDKYFVGGESISIFEYKGLKIASFICYDLRFPEIFSVAAKEADIIVVAANWPEERSDHWKALLKARAIENICYIAGVNCSGTMGGLNYSGDSCIINPNGEIIEEISGTEGSIEYTINNDITMYRNAFPALKDRRTKLYTYLYKKY